LWTALFLIDFLKRKGKHQIMKFLCAVFLNLTASILFLCILCFGPASLAEDLEAKEDAANPPKEEPMKYQGPVWTAHLLRDKANNARIQNLELSEAKLPVTMIFRDQKFRPLVQVPLKFIRPGWTLLIQGKVPLTKTKDPEIFNIYAYLNGRINEMQLVAIGPNKEEESERIFIIAPEAQEYEVISPWDAVRFSLGSSLLSYSQSGFSNYNAWTGLLGAQVHSPEVGAKWGGLAELYMTVLTFESSQELAPQYAQGYLAGIYFLPWQPSSPWRLQVLAGLDYSTMYSNGATFGFKDLISPDIGFRGRYILNKDSDYLMEARYAPLSSSDFFDQRGFVLGISKSWILKNLHRAELGFRYLDFTYNYEGAVKVSIKSTSFVVTYSL
jgi:hypothetical protein